MKFRLGNYIQLALYRDRPLQKSGSIDSEATVPGVDQDRRVRIGSSDPNNDGSVQLYYPVPHVLQPSLAGPQSHEGRKGKNKNKKEEGRKRKEKKTRLYDRKLR